MLIDNVIRTQRVDQPVMWAYDDNTVSRSIFTIGNTFTTSVTPFSGQNLPFQGVVTSYDDSVTDPSRIPDVEIPTNVYVPRNFGRTIFEVAPASSGSDIQIQINLALASGATFPVVHMPAGMYDIQQPIVVPPGSRLHLVGDDAYATALRWNGTGKGPVIEVDGSSVIMEGFRLVQGSGAAVDGFHMPIADQPSTQVIVDDVKMQAGSVIGINFDGLEHSNVELSSTYVMGSTTGVSVTGGPFRAANVGTLGLTNYYSGSAQNEPTSTSFNIALGGRLLVQDNWHDGNSSGARNFVLSGSGMLTEQVGAVFTTSETPFEIGNFSGKVSLIGLMFHGNILTKPASSKTNLLMLGLDGTTPDYQPQASASLVTANILNEYYGSHGGEQIPSGPAPDVKWLRSMLAQTRSQYPVQRLAMSPGGSRARFRRIQVDGLGSAFHFLPAVKSIRLTYGLAIGANLLTTGSKGLGACAVVPQTTPSNSTAWTLIEAGDGDYIIADTTGMYALGVDTTSSAISLSALDNQYDQRWMIQDVGDGRKVLKSRGSFGFLAWTFGGCPSLVADPSLASAKWILTAN